MRTPRTVVPNGLDFDDWNPQACREQEILCVGRAAPEKGIKEAATAVARVLAQHRDWRGRFILSEAGQHPGYLEEVIAELAPISAQIEIERARPWSFVKARCEVAAISIIPSRWEEPFGRTALEAHAGGCAVVSSGTGGLQEISGGNALYLPRNFVSEHIADALTKLIRNPELRSDLARRGLDYSRRCYSIESISAKADEFYDSLRHPAYRSAHG